MIAIRAGPPASTASRGWHQGKAAAKAAASAKPATAFIRNGPSWWPTSATSRRCRAPRSRTWSTSTRTARGVSVPTFAGNARLFANGGGGAQGSAGVRALAAGVPRLLYQPQLAHAAAREVARSSSLLQLVGVLGGHPSCGSASVPACISRASPPCFRRRVQRPMGREPTHNPMLCNSSGAGARRRPAHVPLRAPQRDRVFGHRLHRQLDAGKKPASHAGALLDRSDQWSSCLTTT